MVTPVHKHSLVNPYKITNTHTRTQTNKFRLTKSDKRILSVAKLNKKTKTKFSRVKQWKTKLNIKQNRKKLRTNWNKPGKNLSSASYVGKKGSKQTDKPKKQN